MSTPDAIAADLRLKGRKAVLGAFAVNPKKKGQVMRVGKTERDHASGVHARLRQNKVNRANANRSK